ncbi:MAG: Ig-like domain-containing protein, partial [Cyanobacteria bacterium J06554_1]
ASPVLTVTVDATAPTDPAAAPDLDDASDTGTSNTDDITNDTTPTVSGTGATPDDTVTLYADGVPVGTGTVATDGSYSVTPDSPLTDGTPALTVSFTDPSGNESAQSPALSVTIDGTAPIAPAVPDLVPSSDTGESDSDNITSDTRPTLTGTGTPGETVTLYADGNPVGTATVQVDGTYSITPAVDSPLPDGTTDLTVTLTDASGNESAPSLGLSITVDTTPPSAPGAAPDLDDASDTGSSNADDITSDTTPTVSGTGGTAGDTVTLYIDGAPVGTSTVATDGSYSVTPDSPLSDGTPVLTTTFTDPSGNESAPSPGLNVVIDATAPAIPIVVSPIAGDGVIDTDEQTAVSLSGIAEPNSAVSVNFTDGAGNIVGTQVTADGNGNWSLTGNEVDVTGLQDGQITVATTVTDAAGNVSPINSITALKNTSGSVVGTPGPDVIVGTDGDDIINGLSEDDTLDGGAGNDIVNGGSDEDTLTGGPGDDILNGGSQDDYVEGGVGNDIANGGTGNDSIYGQGGIDVLNGGEGDDLIDGGDGDDLLTGGLGNDSLYGRAGQDRLRGSSGNDVLVGGVGDDLLWGGQGSDTFTYNQVNEFGDTIFDFEIVRDRIDLSAIFNGNASLGSNVIVQQVDNNTAILANTGSGMEQVAMLMNVTADRLDSSNFTF